jgi:hypothetical protein
MLVNEHTFGNADELLAINIYFFSVSFWFYKRVVCVLQQITFRIPAEI